MISVLLINQPLENQRKICDLLLSSPNNFELQCASSYREIVDGFAGKTSDVCLIDSEMESGLKLFAQARSLGYTNPIVLVTPNDAREAIKAIHAGASDCLIRDDLTAAAIEDSICWVVEQARTSVLQTQREHRYLALIDNASDIVYTHDLEGNITSINRIGEQLIGYSQSEILQMNLSQLIAPDYRVVVEHMIARTLDAQTQTAYKVELITRKGDKLLVEIYTHPINENGKTFELQGVAAIPTARPDDLHWKSTGLGKDEPTDEMNDQHILTLQSFGVFPPQEDMTRSGRSLLIF